MENNFKKLRLAENAVNAFALAFGSALAFGGGIVSAGMMVIPMIVAFFFNKPIVPLLIVGALGYEQTASGLERVGNTSVFVPAMTFALFAALAGGLAWAGSDKLTRILRKGGRGPFRTLFFYSLPLLYFVLYLVLTILLMKIVHH